MPTIINLSIQNQLLILPRLRVIFKGQKVTIVDGVIDTGSAGTLLDANIVDQIGISASIGIGAYQVFGVGGSEYVFTHEVILEVEGKRLELFIVEVGDMQTYGTKALIGLDFLMATKALIDLDGLILTLRD